MHSYRIFLVPDELGGYYVAIPAIPECATQGNDREHAISMAKEAIELMLEVMKEDREKIPEDTDMEEIRIEWSGEKYRSFIVPGRWGYDIQIPRLPGCGERGKTRDEALDNTMKHMPICFQEIEVDEYRVAREEEVDMVELKVNI